MKNAILSVSDKTNIEDFASKLIENDYKIFSTGGTKKALKMLGLKYIQFQS